MKKGHVFGILVISIAIIVIISTAGDASAYVTFGEAKKMAANGNENKIHVVGKLPKTDEGEVVGIESSPDRLTFKFELIDENDEQQVVYYPNPMPTDFLRSEQVVVVGAYHNGKFIADKILLKCPSKYQEEGVNV